MTYCPDCGKQLAEQTAFCPDCGRSLVDNTGSQKLNVEWETEAASSVAKPKILGLTILTVVFILGAIVAEILKISNVRTLQMQQNSRMIDYFQGYVTLYGWISFISLLLAIVFGVLLVLRCLKRRKLRKSSNISIARDVQEHQDISCETQQPMNKQATVSSSKKKVFLALGIALVAVTVVLIIVFAGGRPSGTYIYREWTGDTQTIVFSGSNFTHTWQGQVEGGRYELNGSELTLIYTWGYNSGWERTGRYRSEGTIHIGNTVFTKR